MKEGKYIYCVIAAQETMTLGPVGIGDRGDEVVTICRDGLGAVVSNTPIKKYPVSRENLMPHQKVIEKVMESRTVLPVRFCTIAEDERMILKILTEEGPTFRALLEQMEGKKELGLKAVFKEEAIYPALLEKHEDMRRLKEKLISLPFEKTYFQRMELGEMVEKALEEEKELCREEILDVLRPLAEDVKINPTYGERMIVNSAFLVLKEREPEFDEGVNKLGERFQDKVFLKYVGDLPPFNFVNLVIDTRNYLDSRNAKAS